MNILVPDSWLREFLETKATPQQIKDYLSLCGPSVERIHKESGEVIYDIEVTSNRPDSMSVFGIAREAAAILPRFGLTAKLINDPYEAHRRLPFKVSPLKAKKLNIKTDPKLNPRWTSIVLTNVSVGPSPQWLKEKLEASGIRSLNTIVDVTNYLMRAYGQPAHAFDYDEVQPRKNGVPIMILRASKKDERLTTLDGKTHTLPGDDIVIEDGAGRLIDLCGIMGAENSAVKSSTKNVVLFLQTYDPAHIRRTSMFLGHRTEAASLFEKGIDPELVIPAIFGGIKLIKEIAGGVPASKICDFYPAPFKPYAVSVNRTKVDSYLGTKLSDKEIEAILAPLGFQTKIATDKLTVTVPSFRRDISIDVDIIEEIARIWGYHNLATKLPESEPPVMNPDKTLAWEEEIKVRLRDWGYTELLTYSMISESLMDIFELDKTKAYKIANPLSSEWVYLRLHLFPSVLESVRQNLNVRGELKVFELSMSYRYRPNDLPEEAPTLMVVWTGNKFLEAKGLAEAIFSIMGVALTGSDPVNEPGAASPPGLAIYNEKRLTLGQFGSVGEINQELLVKMGVNKPITRLYLDFAKLVETAHPMKKYTPVPKYPAVFEDLAFIVPLQTSVGPMIEAFKKAHPLVVEVALLDAYENVRTFHITYLSKAKNLTVEDIRPIREKLINIAQSKFGASLKAA